MIIVPTFATAARTEPYNLWAVCYNEDYDKKGNPKDIFSKLFDQWNDVSYLLDFFKENEADLARPFWNGISIDQAIDQVQDEAYDFESELKAIELQMPGFEKNTLQDIFHQLHKNEFTLKAQFSNLRKGKPNFPDAMLRLYAIELEDDCMVVTGGAIKLVDKMNERPHLAKEQRRLIQVQDFLKGEGINTREGLL